MKNIRSLLFLPVVIIEMLVFSKPGEIKLLPTYSALFSLGSIDGIRCRTFAPVDHLEWDYYKQGI